MVSHAGEGKPEWGVHCVGSRKPSFDASHVVSNALKPLMVSTLSSLVQFVSQHNPREEQKQSVLATPAPACAVPPLITSSVEEKGGAKSSWPRGRRGTFVATHEEMEKDLAGLGHSEVFCFAYLENDGLVWCVDPPVPIMSIQHSQTKQETREERESKRKI
jgi:hypothetical protein